MNNSTEIEVDSDCFIVEEGNSLDERKYLIRESQPLEHLTEREGDITNRFRNVLRPTYSRHVDGFRIRRRTKTKLHAIALLFLALLILSFYINIANYVLKWYSENDWVVDKYLVSNPKCRMASKNPMDSSITRFIKKLEFQSCSKGPLLSFIEENANGSYFLVIDQKVAKNYEKFVCCWSPITRPVPKKPLAKEWDTKIELGECRDFENRVQLPSDLEIVKLSCRSTCERMKIFNASQILYENIHPILNPAKVQSRLITARPSQQTTKVQRKTSILVLGIDSISNLNFQRSLPKTKRYLEDTDWIGLEGYNKMGENTFPNLMAILTGQNPETACAKCQPMQAYGLDNCPFIWHNFRKAGYITAYGEDVVPLSTFNYQKVGFVNPPTDYYLRPYMVAAEKFLKSKTRFMAKYCTGPELATDRIYNYALSFAKTFLGSPFFGFFWTNSVSHDDMNGASSMDNHFLEMFEEFENSGVTNDTLMVFLSDHGMRWGGIRHTVVGWYEERLPFIYLKLPEWMKNSSLLQSLKINKNRLTSPYDLYETFREVLINSGGNAKASTGCTTCQSLLKPVPIERGCADAGVSSHWCACSVFKPVNINNSIIRKAAEAFLQYVENIIKNYKDGNGRRLCAQFHIHKIHRVDKIISANNSPNDSSSIGEYLYLIEVVPGGGKFEMTISINGKGNYSISDNDIGRINSYEKNSKCLHDGSRKFCHCI